MQRSVLGYVGPVVEPCKVWINCFLQVLKLREKEDKTISAILGPDRSLTDLATPATNSWDGFAPHWLCRVDIPTVEYGSSEKIYNS